MTLRTFGYRRALMVFLAGILTSCGRGSPSTPSAVAGATSLTSANLTFCVDELNRYRATVGRPALARSADLEAYAARAAEDDGRSHQPHGFFAATGGGGMASAENEILWWRGFGVQAVIQQGLRQMWLGGPTGEHYDIMVGNFTQVGCGIFVNGSEVTVAQDFR